LCSFLFGGGVVDHQALLDALEDGTLGGAGLNVFWQEPPDPQDPIFSIMLMPHRIEPSSPGEKKCQSEILSLSHTKMFGKAEFMRKRLRNPFKKAFL